MLISFSRFLTNTRVVACLFAVVIALGTAGPVAAQVDAERLETLNQFILSLPAGVNVDDLSDADLGTYLAEFLAGRNESLAVIEALLNDVAQLNGPGDEDRDFSAIRRQASIDSWIDGRYSSDANQDIVDSWQRSSGGAFLTVRNVEGRVVGVVNNITMLSQLQACKIAGSCTTLPPSPS